ncbi:hypothetical protein N9D31_02745 [Oligoflexaceae bacterium]|nr:hypothetical protein [Oligoflexaceae bacterium]
MSQNSQTEEKKVVSLFDARKIKAQKSEKEPTDSSEETPSFESIMQKNKDASDRMKNDRKKKNQSVLKSYRIKN